MTICGETHNSLQLLCIQFQAQAPLSLLFKIDMDQLTEREAPKVDTSITCSLFLFNLPQSIADIDIWNFWSLLHMKLAVYLEIESILQVTMFVNQIDKTSVGFTFFNLFLIDKSSLLTVSSILLN